MQNLFNVFFSATSLPEHEPGGDVGLPLSAIYQSDILHFIKFNTRYNLLPPVINLTTKTA